MNNALTKVGFIVIILSCMVSGAIADIVIKNGDRIAFLGDSITNYGNYYPSGYVRLVMKGLEINGINAVKIPAGIGGNKSNDMLARLQKHVINMKPDWMLLSCGVNDVWHGPRGVELNDYKKNISQIVKETQKAGIKVCILTATMIQEDPSNDFNRKLAAYNDFLRELAQKENCLLVDLNAKMQHDIATFQKDHPDYHGNLLTVDGVHMAPAGNCMIARCILQAFGLNPSQILKAEQEWENMDWIVGGYGLSIKEYEVLAEKAFRNKQDVPSYTRDLILEDLNSP